MQAADVRRRQPGESGAVLIMTTIMLVVFLGVAALVVDLGGSYANRRKMQNSADSAAIGAAQDLAGASTTNAVAEAQSIGSENLPNATLDWNACAAFPTPAPFTVVPGSNCISFSGDFEQIRVRVPKQTFPTLFGKILGRSSTSTSTVAIAGLQSVGNGGAVFPFAIGSGFGSGDYCIDSGSGGQSKPPCDGPTTGNFGLLSFAHCGGLSTKLDDDIAAGADHVYTANPAGLLPDITDDCTQPGPNTVLSDTGNKVGQESPALLTGLGPYPNPTGGPARLQRLPSASQCGSFSPSWETVSAPCGSQGAIDNRPLWEFIPTGLDPTTVPPSCLREGFDALVASTPLALQRVALHALLKQCITDYAANPALYTVPVFKGTTGNVVDHGLPLFDIQESPRFVYVPQMQEVTPLNGKKTYHIKAFRASFIQRTGANNSPSFFEPGPWNGNTLPDTSTADVTAFVFPPPRANCTPTPTDSCGTMLPGGLGSIDTIPTIIGTNAVIELVG